MFVSRSIHANHSDLIHDVAYDFYGLRMATCSSDQMIKIWDLRADGEWVCTARWRCHLGPAWRVAWAHPEFGQVIATCSFDRTIAIWEEIASGQSTDSLVIHDAENQTPGAVPAKSTSHATASLSSTTNWVRRANLVDPRTSVTGLQFAPRHLGLQLAAISTDGLLRVYEALDVMNLSQWRLQFDFGTKMIGSCLAWSQSRLDPPLIAVGSASPLGSNNVRVDSGNTSVTTESAPAPQSGSAVTIVSGGGSLVTGKLVLYEYSEARRHWDLVQDVRALEHGVHDVQFAPHMGQSYHMLAVGSNDVYILRIRSSEGQASNILPKGDNSLSGSASFSSANIPAARDSYEINLLAQFNHHKGRVWRVSWNVTGSILASSGDDGYVRLWQANHLGMWQPISAIAPDGSQPMGISEHQGQRTSLGSILNMLPPPVRSLGGRLQLNQPSSHAEVETSKSSLGTAVPVIFQKSGSVANLNQPAAWH